MAFLWQPHQMFAHKVYRLHILFDDDDTSLHAIHLYSLFVKD